jgi:hypothetical protein
MRLLCPIILILLSAVNRLGDQLPVSDAITTQFISHDFPRLTAVIVQQTSEEALRCSTIALGLEVDVHDFTILIESPP